MKGILTKVLFITLLAMLVSTVVFAGNTASLFYNILPTEPNNSIIDRNQNVLTFNLWENEKTIYCNDNLVNIIDNKFEININNLVGKQNFVFTNSNNESATFTYYISDENGFVPEYKLENLKSIDTYIRTINGIKVIYTNKEMKMIDKIANCLNNIPENVKSNLKEITLMPYKNSNNVAGVTNYNKIKLYNISRYSENTFKNILLHEVAHTWAYKLMKEKVVDYSYTEFTKAAKQDKKFVSNYSKQYINEKGDYSEDFAESIAFYLMNTNSFSKQYKARAAYIETILN